MSDVHHLHHETKILPISDHLKMLNTQFLATALQPNHPSHRQVTLPPGPRSSTRIPTLQSAYFDQLRHLTVDGIIPPDTIKTALKDIHTRTVTDFLSRANPNKVLGTPPPDIAASEAELPRHHRTTLSQLRSGYCSRLNSFRHRIGLSEVDSCPECGASSHTVHHLFRCPAHPTRLTPVDLWHRPREVAEFLSHHEAFSGLPELPPAEPPAPPPSPEPPPIT